MPSLYKVSQHIMVRSRQLIFALSRLRGSLFLNLHLCEYVEGQKICKKVKNKSNKENRPNKI